MIKKIKNVLKYRYNKYKNEFLTSLNFTFNHKKIMNEEMMKLNHFLNIRNEKLEFIDNIIDCSTIVFSKDRAIQLYALLESYYECVKNPIKPYILYTCSSLAHFKAYDELIDIYGEKATFIKEDNFKNDLINLINELGTEKIFFMTDDGIFVDKFDLNDFVKFNPLKVVANFARGKDCNYCYTYDLYQKIPESINVLVENISFDYLIWIWKQNINSPSFSYPLSLDGALYNRKEIMHILENISFKAPNTLEGNLQEFLEFFIHRYGVAFENTKYINVPINLVQEEVKNLNTGLMDSNFLLDKWNQGLKIDFSIYENMNFDKIQLSPYIFKKRD